LTNRVKYGIIYILVLLFLTGCNSLELKNLGKTTATTVVSYAAGGPLPAVASLATSMAYDEIVPQEKELKTIETKEQAVAYVFDKGFEYTLYGIIAFLTFTNIITPFFVQRRALRRERFNKENTKDDI